jgi:hypothetical protein
MKQFIKKNIESFVFHFDKYNFYIILSLYSCLTIFASLLFSFKFSSMFPNIINDNYIKLENIPFNIGNLINNLIHNHSYKVELYEIDVYLDRLPFVAFITIIISNLSSNIYIFLLIKNFFFFSLFFYFCNKIKYVFNDNLYFFFLLTHIFFFNFYNLQTSLNFVFEDAYISILLPTLFLILINNKIKNQEILVSIFLVLLFFTKTTMIYLTITISILIIFLKKNKSIKKYLPISCIFICMLVWGLFGYIKTARVPFLNSISSTNQQALALVFNEKFKYNYPEKIIDILYPEVIAKNLPSFKSEWEYHDYFKNRNKKYLVENKLEIIEGIAKKLNFLFFNIKDKNRYSISHMLNRIFFFFSLIIFFYKFIKKNNFEIDFYFIAIITTNLLPLIVGWITSKHLVPMFVICQIYCLLNINIFFNDKYKTI